MVRKLLDDDRGGVSCIPASGGAVDRLPENGRDLTGVETTSSFDRGAGRVGILNNVREHSACCGLSAACSIMNCKGSDILDKPLDGVSWIELTSRLSPPELDTLGRIVEDPGTIERSLLRAGEVSALLIEGRVKPRG
jgi:hypothetical protein